MNLDNVTFRGSWGDLPGKVWKKLSKGGAYKWCTEDYKTKYEMGDETSHRFGKFAPAGNIITVDGGKKDEVPEAIPFTKEDALEAAEHFKNEKLPVGSDDGEGVRAAYGFSVNGNAGPYFKYQKYKNKEIVKKAKKEHYGLLAHIFWVQGCNGYMMEDAVGVAVAKKIGKGRKNEWGGYDDYLIELTSIMEEDDEAAFNILLKAYNSIESTDEIDQMKQTDINSFEAFRSVTGGGLRRKATKRKAIRRKSIKRRKTKRKATRRKNSKRKNTRRRKRR